MAQFDDSSPIYRQIAEQIKADILSGALLEEEQVMSTNQYAAFYRINPATAAKAFQQLVEGGSRYAERGAALSVGAGADEAHRSDGRRRAAADGLAPLIEEASCPGLGVDERVAEIGRVHARMEQESDDQRR